MDGYKDKMREGEENGIHSSTENKTVSIVNKAFEHDAECKRTDPNQAGKAVSIDFVAESPDTSSGILHDNGQMDNVKTSPIQNGTNFQNDLEKPRKESDIDDKTKSDLNSRTSSADVDKVSGDAIYKNTVSRTRLMFIAIGSFILYFCSWGMAQSFGMMYIELLDKFGGSRGETTWVASIFSGIQLLSGPVAGILLRKFGCRVVGVVGSVFLSGGLLASVFTPSLYVLYGTYGVIGGFGGSLLFTTAGVVVLENFVTRASMTLGICSAGAAAGALLIPLLTQAALERYGFRGTFLLLSGLSLQCLVMSLTFGPKRKQAHNTEPKHPPEEPKQRPEKPKPSGHGLQQLCSFFNVGYTLYALSWAFMMLPFLVPFTFLPDAALSKGNTKQEAAYIASALGLGSILGKAAFGFLGDVKCLETMLMHIVPIFMFGILNLLYVFVSGFVSYLFLAIFIGLTSAICDGIHPFITLQLVGKDHLSVALGVLYFLMSITTVLGTPIAGWIADAAGRYDEPFYYCAASSCLAALTAVYVPFWKRKHRKMTAWLEIDVPA